MTWLFVGVIAFSAVVVVATRQPPPRLAGDRMTRRVALPDARFVALLGPGAGLVLNSPVTALMIPLTVGFAIRERRRRNSRLAEAVRSEAAATFVASMTAGLRAGRSLATAAAGATDANPRQQQVAEQLEAGRPFASAVAEVFREGSADERLIATTIQALESTGASAFHALERVEEALRERRSSRDEARTQAQQALSSAAVLAALPLVFGCAAALAEPDVGRLYTSTWLGAGCVGVSAALVFASWEWLQRLLEPRS